MEHHAHHVALCLLIVLQCMNGVQDFVMRMFLLDFIRLRDTSVKRAQNTHAYTQTSFNVGYCRWYVHGMNTLQPSMREHICIP